MKTFGLRIVYAKEIYLKLCVEAWSILAYIDRLPIAWFLCLLLALGGHMLSHNGYGPGPGPIFIMAQHMAIKDKQWQ